MIVIDLLSRFWNSRIAVSLHEQEELISVVSLRLSSETEIIASFRDKNCVVEEALREFLARGLYSSTKQQTTKRALVGRRRS